MLPSKFIFTNREMHCPFQKKKSVLQGEQSWSIATGDQMNVQDAEW